MEPHFSEKDKEMFYWFLDRCGFYFEFGSGGSTYQASIRQNICRIISVESDINWYNKLTKEINCSHFFFKLVNLNCEVNTWGHPGQVSLSQKKSYSSVISDIPQSISKKIDFILIDGRFRVACCLKAFESINDSCLIAFDDFIPRKNYHFVLNFYDIVTKTEDERMVILKKKTGIPPPDKHSIDLYELISD